MRRAIALLAVLAAIAVGCADDGDGSDPEATTTTPTSTTSTASSTSTTSTTTTSTTTTTTMPPVELPVFDDEPCGNVTPDPMGGRYAELFARWQAQVDAAPWEPGRPVFVGSSSIRLWSGLQSEFSDWAPIQRGFGGSIIWEVAWAAEHLIVAHDPSAVVIFAGTNDFAVDAGVEPTFNAYRCIIDKVRRGVGDIPIAMIAITPAPSRWDGWETVEEWHDLVAELSDAHSGLHFVDTRDAFLATGEPPSADLFLGDLLHLNDDGYALWNEIVRDALADVIPVAEPPTVALTGGQFLVDLGAEPTRLDERTWNLAPSAREGRLTPGEQWVLVDRDGGPSPARLVVAEWNMTTTEDGAGIWVRPLAPGGFTLENVEPGTLVRVQPFFLEKQEGGPLEPSWETTADEYGRAHIRFNHVGDEPVGIDALLITVGTLTAEVLVTTDDIPAGTPAALAFNSIARTEVPAAIRPSTAISVDDLDALQGLVAVDDIPRNQIIVEGLFADPAVAD